MSPVMDRHVSHVFSHLFDLILFIALSFIFFVLPCLLLSCHSCHSCLVLSTPISYSSLTPLFSFHFSSLLSTSFILFVTFSRSFSFPNLSAPSFSFLINFYYVYSTLNQYVSANVCHFTSLHLILSSSSKYLFEILKLLLLCLHPSRDAINSL